MEAGWHLPWPALRLARRNPCQADSESPNCPPRCECGDHEHDRRFPQFGHSRPESRDNPQCANGSEHDARSEYEREIKHAIFQNRLRLPRDTRRTIGHEQNTSRMPRLGPF